MIMFEEALKPIVIKNKSKILRGTFSGAYRGFESTDEMVSDFGVVDVLFYKFRSNYLAKRRTASNISSSDLINTLLYVGSDKSKIFSVTSLKSLLPYTENEIEKILLKHEKLGLIKRLKGKNYRAIYNYKIGLQTGLAIELKLKDWKRGFYQAYRYKWFAEISYLALYSRHAKQAIKNIELFKRYNVGLIQIFDDETIEIIYKPKAEKPLSVKSRAFANESLVKKFIR